MKRFWKQADAVVVADGWGVNLDGRPVRTPARAILQVPTAALANAIAGEWNAVGDVLNPRDQRLTGLANAAIDRIAPDRESFVANLANYAQGDLACYRADGPRALVERQEEPWDALLAWARRRYDVDFCTTNGIMHVNQPPATVERLSLALAVLDPFELAGLAPLVTIGGSLLAALAVFEEARSADDAWAIVTVDDRWQAEQWGVDAEAQAALDGRHQDFQAAARFLGLLRA